MLLATVGMAVTATAGCETPGDTVDAGPSASVRATEVADPADAVTNGIDDMAPDEALDQARAALAAAESFRVTGSPTQGQTLDLVFVAGSAVDSAEPTSRESDAEVGDADPPARGARGTVSQDGSTFQLRSVDGAVYVRGDLDWLADEVATGAARTLGGKWLLLPQEAAQDLTAFADPAAFIDALLTAQGALQWVGASVIAEVPAVGIRVVDSEATVWLSGIDMPYPLLVERLGATAEQGVVRFDEIDEPATLSAPRTENVVVAPEPSE
jgi:hypothetical protein